MGQLTWHHLDERRLGQIAERYVFDSRMLTNARPYFAAYVRPVDLPRITDRLELFQDEWGYILLWATLGIACIAATSLVALPVIFGWRTIFSRYPGKFRTIVYFACLGLGYIMVEVGFIAEFILALSNPIVSASVLITGMLVFSGLGSLVSERFLDRARNVMPVDLPRHRRAADRLRPLPRPRARFHRHIPLCAPPRLLLRADFAARLSHGLSDADRHDLARAARQGATCSCGPGASTAASR